MEHKDIENLRIWRNDKVRATFLRNIPPLTPAMQEKWFEEYKSRKGDYTFAIEDISAAPRLIGSISLYNFRDQRAEYGRFMIGGEETSGKGAGRMALFLCLYFGFEVLGLETIDASVHWENYRAIKTNIKNGFVITGHHPFGDKAHELEIVVCKSDFYHLHRDVIPQVQIDNSVGR